MSGALSISDPRLAAVRRLATDQGGVASRRQLYALGVTRWEIRGEVRARRWQLIGDQSVCLHNASVNAVGHRWAAVFQGGPRACLDGVSALVAGGLDRLTETHVRVSVPRGARIRRSKIYNIRQTRRWDPDDLAPTGIPRTRPAVAAVHGALSATTDRQASYIVTLVVQQGLARPEEVGEVLLRVKRDRRRGLLHSVVNDLLGGARSLGELDIARALRRRGLPPPTRQVLRRGRRNRYYLDLYWDAWRLVVEIDGIHHTWAENIVADALRQNSLSISGDTVLRLPLLGYRLCPEEFLDQIEEALRAAGWAAAA
jgi:very-short-patch-repair endonuclease